MPRNIVRATHGDVDFNAGALGTRLLARSKASGTKREAKPRVGKTCSRMYWRPGLRGSICGVLLFASDRLFNDSKAAFHKLARTAGFHRWHRRMISSGGIPCIMHGRHPWMTSTGGILSRHPYMTSAESIQRWHPYMAAIMNG